MESTESTAKNEIEIEPVTRLEGHGKVTIVLSKGKVKDVQFNVTAVRFFEKFLEGRRAEDAPIITPRICGICPQPHHLASIKAVEGAWGVTPPPAASKLRELMLLGKMIQSHTLHFYALAAPDFVVGPFADTSARNVVTIAKHLPDVVTKALELMRHGQELAGLVGGKPIHPVTAIPGGMSKPLIEKDRDDWLKKMERIMELAEFTASLGLKVVESYWDVITRIGVVETYYIGLASQGVHNFYEGTIRVMSPKGKIEADFSPKDYLDFVGEHAVPHCYVTHLYYKPAGYPDGIWRANTLARINVVDRMAMPRAQELLKDFRSKVGRPCHATFAYHWARLIELIESVERARQLLEDPQIVSQDIKVEDVQPRQGNGVGCVEAPRGTLIHNYWTDEKGIITKANLIVATNNNVGAIEKCLQHVAKQCIEEKAHEKVKFPTPMIKV
nr:Ni/Fe hydrogenase subunit alpha [Candidatus Njordarchaeota archaeon]